MNSQAHAVTEATTKERPVPPRTNTAPTESRDTSSPAVANPSEPISSPMDAAEHDRQGSLALLDWLVMGPKPLH